MILSICICTLEARAAKLSLLVAYIGGQIHAANATDLVEIIIEQDRGENTTGAKRNKLYQRAQGKYVCSVDDDDWVSPYYVREILKALETEPDAVAMNGNMTTNGGQLSTWDISLYNPYVTTRKNNRIHYLRFHNHLSPIKKEIAIRYPFPDTTVGEDYAFAEKMHKEFAIKTEVQIALPMYEYRYNTINKNK